MTKKNVSTVYLKNLELCYFRECVLMCAAHFRRLHADSPGGVWKALFSNLIDNYIIACALRSATLLTSGSNEGLKPNVNPHPAQREDVEAGTRRRRRGRRQDSLNKKEHFWLLMAVILAYTHLLWCQSIDWERQYQRGRGEQRQCKCGNFAMCVYMNNPQEVFCVRLWVHQTRLHTKEEDKKHKNALFIIHNYSCQKEGTSKWQVCSTPSNPLGIQKEPHPTLET